MPTTSQLWPSAKTFALVDCNNFYCSCERVFNPKLRGKPVVVLSNNDGCAIARSEEAKKLGIKMGEPFFKIRDLVKKHGVQVFSSNYVLYGDMSHRVMSTLRQFAPSQEIYSIDESFLDFNDLPSMISGRAELPLCPYISSPSPREGRGEVCLTSYALKIRQTVLQHTGIPVSIGIAPTKVLAKAANKMAKRNPECKGVLDFTNSGPLGESGRALALEKFECGDLWGIGRQLTKLLAAHGISSALQLKRADRNWIRKEIGVVGERIVLELNGISCIELEEVSEPRKNICCSRSFGKLITEKSELKEAVANYICRAAEKLRVDKTAASVLQVFLLTNPFRNEPQYTPQLTLRLPEPTSYTPTLMTHALNLVDKMFRAGFNYNKAGVLLCDLIPETEIPQDLFVSLENRNRKESAIATVDRLNRKFGRNKIQFAAQGFEQDWKIRAEHRSPFFTTRWSDLLQIHL